MKTKCPIALFIAWFALALAPTDAAHAAHPSSTGSTVPPGSTVRSETGIITGRVMDKATGAPLERARVVLVGTSLTTSTERDGSFTLRAVPAGEHVVVASYAGFNSASRPVQAQGGRDTIVQLELSSDIVEMDAYVVNFRRGEADEIMLRRQATTIVDAVSSKTFGEMADGSLSISRLAGMTGGTGIRGIAGEFNLVRVDGGALATPNRGLQDATAGHGCRRGWRHDQPDHEERARSEGAPDLLFRRRDRQPQLPGAGNGLPC
jgi:hypothetical protein